MYISNDIVGNVQTWLTYGMIWSMIGCMIMLKLLCGIFSSDNSGRHDTKQDDQRQDENTIRTTTQCSNCKQLKQENEELQEENRELSRMLRNIPTTVPKKNIHLVFEDLCDASTNTKLKERFCKLNSGEWLNLYKSLSKGCKDDLHVINIISDIMKNLYGYCKQEADERLRNVAFGNSIPSPDDFPGVYQFRRESGQQKDALQKINMVMKEKYSDPDQMMKIKTDGHTTKSLATCKFAPITMASPDDGSARNSMRRNTAGYPGFTSSPGINFSDPDIKSVYERFCEAFVKCSWLMIIAVPPIELHFDVSGILDKTMEERFEKHPTNDNVTDYKAVNTITQIVWPELDDNHGIHARGSVVTVDVSLDTEL